MPSASGLDEENLKALVLVSCEYLSGLNTACSWRDRHFRPLIEARVQTELYELLLGWIEVLPLIDSRSATAEITASVVSWAIFGAGLQWSRNEGVGPVEEFAEQTLSVIVKDLRL